MVPTFGFSLAFCRMVEAICSVPRMANWCLWTALIVLFCNYTTQMAQHPLFWVPIIAIQVAWLWRDVVEPIYVAVPFRGAVWSERGFLALCSALMVYFVTMVVRGLMPDMVHDAVVTLVACVITVRIIGAQVGAEERLAKGGTILSPELRAAAGKFSDRTDNWFV